jgi:hypothetical protein
MSTVRQRRAGVWYAGLSPQCWDSETSLQWISWCDTPRHVKAISQGAFLASLPRGFNLNGTGT